MPAQPKAPRLPSWWTGPDDPWLSRRMRDIAAIEAGERDMLDAASKAIGVFLDAARVAMLGPTGAHNALTAATPPEQAPEDETPPDLNAWPEEGVWKAAVDRFIVPVVERLFSERFRSETAKAVVKAYSWRQSYLAEVWSRLKIWPVNAWEDLRPEIAEGLAEGEGHREIRARIGRALGIDAPTRKAEAEINHLTKTIENPETPPQIRREAKARRAALYRAKDREESRWWYYAARIARTETLGALNGGTYYGATALAQITGDEKFKQWWCLHPDSVVQARGVVWVARRHHDGEMVQLATKGGARLALTPSHPVLTTTGWVMAGELTTGSRLVRTPNAERGDRIGFVAEACLRRHEEAGTLRQVSRDHDEVTVAPADADLVGAIVPADSDVLSELADHNVSDIRIVPLVQQNLNRVQSSRRPRADAGRAARAVDRLALDTVTEIERVPYSGPVYDLTTRVGYFEAGGLIVHNSTTDDRVRPSHWAAHMQVQPLATKFRVGGFELDHPGDPDGPAHEVINCRCSLLTMGRAEADRERERYEAFRKGRTDNKGREIDEDGRPVVASADCGEGPMPQKKFRHTRTVKPVPAAGFATETETPPAAETVTAGTSLPWRGVLAPLGHVSSDYRRIDAPAGGKLLTRDLPLPLLFQESLRPGHGDAVQGMANIRRAWIDTVAAAREMGLIPDGSELADDVQVLIGEGNFDANDPEAVKLASKVRDQFLRFVSVDLDKVGEPSFRVYRDGEDVGELELDEDLFFLECLGLAQQEGIASQFGITVAGDDDGNETVECDRPWSVAAHLAEQAGFRDLFTALRRSADFRARFGIELTEGDEIVEAIAEWRLMSTTMVSQPAFPEAYIVMMEEEAADLAASADAPVIPIQRRPARPPALVAAAQSWAHRVAEAAAQLHEPPRAWFEDPQLDRPTNPTVTAEGEVYGHIHDWTTSHIGFPGKRVRAPESASGYSYFNLKPVRCDNGDSIRCGSLVSGIGHAPVTKGITTNQAVDHYDNSTHRVARIRVGRDQFGTWFHGALVPGVSAEQVLEIAEMTVSGDWREGELRAALLVPVPGLPIVEGEDNRTPSAMVAAGAIVREDWGIADLEPAAPGHEQLVADITASVIAAIDQREVDRTEAARLATEQQQREDALAFLLSRSRVHGVEVLSDRVYAGRAARVASRFSATRTRRGVA